MSLHTSSELHHSLRNCVAESTIVRIASQSPIELFAQEPRFTDLDIAFLKSLDITVVQNPEAERLVGPETFLFVALLEWTLEIPYMVAARDAPLYITSSMDWIIGEAERSLPELPYVFITLSSSDMY